ncbi:MAG: hypothetical protein JXA33_00290 [Anaerolineae bacterium]|nr:hypothetical protein [Anaerolineae bacterium]
MYTLTQNEYLFLHAAFRSAFAWGVQTEFADDAAERVAMETAFSTLQEKGYVSLASDQMYLPPELWSLMKVCTAPQQVLLWSYADGHDTQDLRFVYWGGGILVEDRVLPAHARQLQQIETVADLVESLKAYLKLAQQPQTGGVAQTLPVTVLAEVKQIAAQGPAVVQDKLVQAGVDATSAASLAQVYAAPVATVVLARVIPGEEGMATSMVLIESAAGLWELHALDATQMAVAPVDAETAGQMIAGFCGVERGDLA